MSSRTCPICGHSQEASLVYCVECGCEIDLQGRVNSLINQNVAQRRQLATLAAEEARLSNSISDAERELRRLERQTLLRGQQLGSTPLPSAQAASSQSAPVPIAPVVDMVPKAELEAALASAAVLSSRLAAMARETVSRVEYEGVLLKLEQAQQKILGLRQKLAEMAATQAPSQPSSPLPSQAGDKFSGLKTYLKGGGAPTNL